MIDIQTTEIDKYIHEQLIKPYSTKLTEEDILNVKKIVLNKYNLKGETIKYDYSDLKYLVNLEKCSIEILEITNPLVENINTLTNITTLELSHNKIECTCQFHGSFKKLIFKQISESILNLIENSESVETIEIIDFKNINVDHLLRFKNVKNLYIYHSTIVHSENLKELQKLQNLKLDGSTLDNESILDHLKDRVNIQKRDNFLLADA